MLLATVRFDDKEVKAMQNDRENVVLITQEACDYLRISRPTYVKNLLTGRIKGIKIGKGWRVLKSELDRFLQGENERKASKESLVKEGRAISHSSFIHDG